MSTKLSLKSATAAKKISSPLAKYNSIGQLFCVLCNTQIKNEMYWTGHINGKAHRDQVLLIKNKGAPPSTSPVKRPASSDGNGISSNSSSSGSSVPKRSKIDDSSSSSSSAFTDSMNMAPPTSTLVLKSSKSPSPVPVKKTFQEIEAEEALMEIDMLNNFNRNANASDEDDDEEESTEGEASTTTTASFSASANLPAGFFDDAKEDAKARGIEYKNPDEAEWDKFVKEIASEDVKSSVLRTADEEYSAKDRELDEIEEQMKNWQRVLELERKAEEARKQQVSRDNNPNIKHEEDMNEDEDADYDEDLDWRTKKY